MSLIIFTGLDEILLPSETRDYESESLLAVIKKLQQQHIPLIPVTDHTRAEVVELSAKIGWNIPMVVEHGSGIFIPQENSNFAVSETSKLDNYYLHQLGCTYTEARAALKAVQEEINKILRGFGDLDEENIQSLTGLSTLGVRRAKTREFSEYFVTPNRLEMLQLEEVATEYGFKILPGDNLSLIVGGDADQDKAVAWLKQNYQASSTKPLITIGLGSTKQDLLLLEAVDIPVIIPRSQGVNPSFADKNWRIASSSGLGGWLKAILQICQDYQDYI
jgi:mannosyl-3-phosphoglycerate phosphatase